MFDLRQTPLYLSGVLVYILAYREANREAKIHDSLLALDQ